MIVLYDMSTGEVTKQSGESGLTVSTMASQDCAEATRYAAELRLMTVAESQDTQSEPHPAVICAPISDAY